MNSKSILYFSFLILGLVLSLGLVSASENIIDTQAPATVESSPAGAGNNILSSSPDDGKLSVDIDVPDVDIYGPDAKLVGPKFKMPEMNIKAPKAPEVDIKGPKVDIDVPDVDIKGPKVDIDVPSGISMPDIDLNIKGPKVKGDVDVSVPKSPFYDVDDVLGEQQEGQLKLGPTTNFYNALGESAVPEVYPQQQQQQQQQQKQNLVIEKFWENDDSGSITYVEVEVYRKLQQESQVPEVHVEQQQQSPPLGESHVEPDTVIFNINGEDQSFVFVGRYNITKENNWKLVLDNVNFIENYDTNLHEWVTDFGTYFVREVNLPESAIPVYSGYSRHDEVNGLNVYWNLTNSYVPDEPEILGDSPDEPLVNETPVENETTPENVTETPSVNSTQNPVVNETTPVVEGNTTVEKNETTPVNESVPGEKKSLDVADGTGNPLVLLLMVIAILGVGLHRRD